MEKAQTQQNYVIKKVVQIYKYWEVPYLTYLKNQIYDIRICIHYNLIYIHYNLPSKTSEVAQKISFCLLNLMVRDMANLQQMKFILNNMIQISNKILGLKKTSKGVSEKYFLTLTVLCCYICFSLYLKFFNFHCPVSYPFIYSEQLHVIIIFKRLLLIFPSSSYLVPHFKMHHISIFLT